jgi:DNA-directed RNA polymerase subunit RPC12/RpoP
MHLECSECKNDVDLSKYDKLEKDKVVECDKCGITLAVTEVNGDEVKAEVVEEGK